VDEAAIQDHLASQFLASLAMLRTAIEKCPEELWLSAEYRNRYWHIAYHTLFCADMYLQANENEIRPRPNHQPGAQFLGSSPSAPDVPIVIERPYSQEEVLAYHAFCCAEVRTKVPAFELSGPSGFHWLPFSKLEVHLYNLRHIQHHTGQLADRLRAHAGLGVPWVRMG
jgi:hypothetical protein